MIIFSRHQILLLFRFRRFYAASGNFVQSVIFYNARLHIMYLDIQIKKYFMGSKEKRLMAESVTVCAW